MSSMISKPNGPSKNPIKPNRRIPTYIDISVSIGDKPTFSPMILASSICLNTYAIPNMESKTTPENHLFCIQRMIPQGTKMIPAPTNGRASINPTPIPNRSAYSFLIKSNPSVNSTLFTLRITSSVLSHAPTAVQTLRPTMAISR